MYDLSTRYLRGGSGGGGGGGGGGGHGGGGGGGGGEPFVGFFVVLYFVGRCFGCIPKPDAEGEGSSSRVSIGNDTGFDAALSTARSKRNRRRDTILTLEDDSSYKFETYAGEFGMIYSDRGVRRCGTIKLLLKNNNEDGFVIDGSSNDDDGSAIVTEGLVSYSGDAWWVEETFRGTDRGLKVLTEGTLDFSTNSFTGNWRSNSGLHGPYTHFMTDRVVKTHKPEPQAHILHELLQEMRVDENIPMAIPIADAAEKLPVVAAADHVARAVPESTSLLAPLEPDLVSCLPLGTNQAAREAGTNAEHRVGRRVLFPLIQLPDP